MNITQRHSLILTKRSSTVEQLSKFNRIYVGHPPVLAEKLLGGQVSETEMHRGRRNVFYQN